MKLLRKAKFDYYKNIDLGNLTDNHKFWKTVKQLFSDKMQVNSAITLIEDGKMVSEDYEIAEIFNHFFADITESLGISANESLMLPADDIQDPIDRATRKFDSHPSICKIKENTTFSERFEFREVAVEDVAVQIRKLNINKASPVNSIPARILKENSDVLSVAIQNMFNSGLSKGTFPKELKAGDISSLFKKRGCRYEKELPTHHSLAIGIKNLRKIDARSNATFRPKFPVLIPLWVSRRLWYTACTSTSSGSLQEDNRQWGRRRGCLDGPFEGLRLSKS